jgi:hypothetical protein
MRESIATHSDVKKKLCELYDELAVHDGFGDLKLEIRLLRRGQKEVLLFCGKQYRFVINHRPAESKTTGHGLPERDNLQEEQT